MMIGLLKWFQTNYPELTNKKGQATLKPKIAIIKSKFKKRREKLCQE